MAENQIFMYEIWNISARLTEPFQLFKVWIKYAFSICLYPLLLLLWSQILCEIPSFFYLSFRTDCIYGNTVFYHILYQIFKDKDDCISDLSSYGCIKISFILLVQVPSEWMMSRSISDNSVSLNQMTISVFLSLFEQLVIFKNYDVK